MSFLSQDEDQELKDRPIGSDFVTHPLTAEQLAKRKVIAKKIWENLAESDPTMTPEYKEAYDKRPPWQFYCSPGGDAPRRTFGVLQVQDEDEFRYHTCTAHLFWCNLVVGGCKLEDLEVVENWNEGQKATIASCGSPSDFLDPCGYFSLMMSQAS